MTAILRLMGTVRQDVLSASQQFGRYQLVAKLATGGMAEIHLARRQSTKGRPNFVVIKRMLPHLADDPNFTLMFRDEARLAALIEHPNVCKVHDVGVVRDTYFIAMEHLRGVPMSRILKHTSAQGDALDLPLIAGIMWQACEGLHAAHELKGQDGNYLGVIHRDVSPPNLFVTEAGVVKLLDFGIAKAAGASSKTRTGHIKGKHAYMSPEQILDQPLDRRSDVFALGTVLYEALALTPLFQRGTDFLTFKAITEHAAPDLAAVRPDIPDPLCRVVMRALERDRDLRFATAKEFGEAIVEAAEFFGGPAKPQHIAAMIQTDFGPELRRRRRLLTNVTARVNALKEQAQAALAARGSAPDVDIEEVDIEPEGVQVSRQMSGQLDVMRPRHQEPPPPIPAPEDRSTIVEPIAMGAELDSGPVAPQAQLAPPVDVSVVTTTQPNTWSADSSPGIAAVESVGALSSAAWPRQRESRTKYVAFAAIATMAIAAATAVVCSVTSSTDEKPAEIGAVDRPDRRAASGGVQDNAATRGDVASNPGEAPVLVSPNDGSTKADLVDASAHKAEPDERVTKSGTAVASPRDVGVRDPEKTKDEKRPEDRRPGYYSIDSTPYATIYIDGRRVGLTPLYKMKLKAGRHRVKAVLASGKTKRFSVRIKPGRSVSSGRLKWN